MIGDVLPPLTGVDPALNEIVLKACAFHRKERFDNATEMKEALEALAEHGVYAPTSPEPLPVPVTPREYGAENPERESTNLPEKTESVFADRPESKSESKFESRSESDIERTGNADGEKSKESKVAAPPVVVKKLAVLGGALFGLLGIIYGLGGFAIPVFIFFPLYALCAAQCALRFRSKYVNAFFLSVVVFYLSYSFFFAFEIFDYHLFIVTCSLFALESTRMAKRNHDSLLCFSLVICAAATGILTVRSIYGIYGGAYHAYVSGSIAIPFLMLLIALAGLLLTQNKNASRNCAVACLIVSQNFPFIAFVLHGMISFNSVSRNGSIDTLFYIASANFLRVSPNLYLWQWDWRFVGLTVLSMIQCSAFVLFFALALAQMKPSVFVRVFDKGNRKNLLFSIAGFLVVVAILTKVMSQIPEFLP
jgi:hypothetical protein